MEYLQSKTTKFNSVPNTNQSYDFIMQGIQSTSHVDHFYDVSACFLSSLDFN